MGKDVLQRGRRKIRIAKKFVFAGLVMILYMWSGVALAAVFNGDKLPDYETAGAPPQQEAAAAGPKSDRDVVVRESRAVDNAFFDDAVFIGNSLTEGLMLYGGLDNASYYASKGLMVDSVFTRQAVMDGSKRVSIRDALGKNHYRKVYLMLGLNELGWCYDSVFADQYAQVVDQIRALQPQAEIYVQSIFPVTKQRSAEDQIFNNPRIQRYNQLIVQMCQQKKVYYLNVAEALEDENGFLPDIAACADGIHLTPASCEKWAGYLAAHTIQP